MLLLLMFPIPLRFALSRPTADIAIVGAVVVAIIVARCKGVIPLVAHWVRGHGEAA